jgi:hypothetical protein
MFKFFTPLLLISVLSCNYSTPQENNNNKEGVETVIARDTLIFYDIEGISTEGANAEVEYENGKISNSVIKIYTGTGQVSVTYEFQNDKIKVTEERWFYNTEIQNVKSDHDMTLDRKLSYFIDFEGNVIGEIPLEITAVFIDFKNVVPFHIKQ